MSLISGRRPSRSSGRGQPVRRRRLSCSSLYAEHDVEGGTRQHRPAQFFHGGVFIDDDSIVHQHVDDFRVWSDSVGVHDHR